MKKNRYFHVFANGVHIFNFNSGYGSDERVVQLGRAHFVDHLPVTLHELDCFDGRDTGKRLVIE